MAAAVSSLAAGVISLIDLNTLILLLGSISCFFVYGFLRIRLKEEEPSSDRKEWG
jgi:hypothetical protein